MGQQEIPMTTLQSYECRTKRKASSVQSYCPAGFWPRGDILGFPRIEGIASYFGKEIGEFLSVDMSYIPTKDK